MSMTPRRSSADDAASMVPARRGVPDEVATTSTAPVHFSGRMGAINVSRQVVEEVFTEILGLDDPVDWSAVQYQQVEGWDSLAHMAIVVELEERFGVMFESDDIIGMSSFERALEILRGYGVESL